MTTGAGFLDQFVFANVATHAFFEVDLFAFDGTGWT